MKVGIMQPYFFPYLGYWQLMNSVERYLIYDNIQFTKNSWIRRNRILVNGSDKLFTLPLKKDSDYLDVRDRVLADDFSDFQEKFLKQIQLSYKKAPFIDAVYPVIEEIVRYEDINLFNYIYHSVESIRNYLGICSELIISSTVTIDESLKGKDKVLALCKCLEATEYYNSVNGIPLYEPHRQEFEDAGIRLRFPKMREITYPQFGNEFVPNLSIIDVMMFNSQEKCRQLLTEYDFVDE